MMSVKQLLQASLNLVRTTGAPWPVAVEMAAKFCAPPRATVERACLLLANVDAAKPGLKDDSTAFLEMALKACEPKRHTPPTDKGDSSWPPKMTAYPASPKHGGGDG